MKIDRFIFRDEVDKNFADLILLAEPVERDVIIDTIDKVKKEYPGEWDYEMMYEELKKVLKIEKIYDLYYINEFTY